MSEFKILDHGYVKVIESWGSDARIIEAARMSTDKGFQGWGKREQCEHCKKSVDELCNTPEWMACGVTGSAHHMGPYGPPGDEKLLRYLYEHKHMTPFEMAGLVLEVQAPIFVFREWHRHRTQSYNELSARYTELPNLFYVPSIPRLQAAQQDLKNKQGSAEGILPVTAELLQRRFRASYEASRQEYERLLATGVAREVARMVIPVAQYSRMRASANLRNWLAFLTLRMDPAAQLEIRTYANAVGNLVKERFPRTYQLFEENRG